MPITSPLAPLSSRICLNIFWRWRWLTVLAACLVAGGSLSVYLGQDSNWDLKNYHIYNPWALLDRRGDIDLFAAGIQSYFNPVLDLPYYLLAFEWLPQWPRVVAFVAGLPYGLLVCLTLHLANTVLSDLALTAPYRAVAIMLTVAFGVTGAATLPQVGTTFNEIQVASLVVGGLALLLYGLRKGAPTPDGRFAFLGGLLFGLAAGLKLTASIYAPAAVLALFAAATHKPRAIRAIAVFSIAWMIGCALTLGWWGYRMYTSTGNPVFPMLEGIFGSQGLGTGTWLDNKFKPSSFTQALLFPFFWIDSTVPTVAEPLFSDPRFALALFALFGFAALLVLSRMGRPAFQPGEVRRHVMPNTGLFVLVFVATSYVIWLKMFSILRYAVPIEVLLGLVIAIVTSVVCRRFLQLELSQKALVFFLAALLVGTAAKTQYPRWGRAAYGVTVLQVQPVALAPNTLLVLIGSPQAFVLPSISRQNPSVQFVGTTDDLLSARGFGLWNKVMRRIADFSGGMYVMVRADQIERLEMLPKLNLSADKNDCKSVVSSIDSDFRICLLRRVGP